MVQRTVTSARIAGQYESSVVSQLPGGLSMRHIVADVLALFLLLLPAAAQTAELSESVKQVVRVEICWEESD